MTHQKDGSCESVTLTGSTQTQSKTNGLQLRQQDDPTFQRTYVSRATHHQQYDNGRTVPTAVIGTVVVRVTGRELLGSITRTSCVWAYRRVAPSSLSPIHRLRLTYMYPRNAVCGVTISRLLW